MKPIPPQPLTDPEGLSLRAAGAEELVEVLALGELAALLPLRLELLALAAHLVHEITPSRRAQEASGLRAELHALDLGYLTACRREGADLVAVEQHVDDGVGLPPADPPFPPAAPPPGEATTLQAADRLSLCCGPEDPRPRARAFATYCPVWPVFLKNKSRNSDFVL